MNSSNHENGKNLAFLRSFQFLPNFCCRKTAVCIGDELLDFFVPELVRSQSTFFNPEVL